MTRDKRRTVSKNQLEYTGRPVKVVDHLCIHSLYDALASIHVPNEKARAAVAALERDMAATIATKADRQLLKQELLAPFRANASELRQGITLVRKDPEILSTTVTVRLGSMLMPGLRSLLAALKLT